MTDSCITEPSNTLCYKDNQYCIKAGIWFQDYWKISSNAICTIILAIMGMLYSNISFENGCGYLQSLFWIIFVALCFVFIYSVYLLAKEQKTVSEYEIKQLKLQQEIEKQESENSEYWKKILTFLFQELNFSSSERISIYKFENKEFVNISRYSINPKYNRKSNRTSYPENQGCIGLAWEKGFAFFDDIPDYDANKPECYKFSKESFNMDEKVIDNLSMRSRTISGTALTNPENTDRTAVIIFESDKEKAFNEDSIKDITAKFGKILSIQVERYRDFEPSPNFAKQEGF